MKPFRTRATWTTFTTVTVTRRTVITTTSTDPRYLQFSRTLSHSPLVGEYESVLLLLCCVRLGGSRDSSIGDGLFTGSSSQVSNVGDLWALCADSNVEFHVLIPLSPTGRVIIGWGGTGEQGYY